MDKNNGIVLPIFIGDSNSRLSQFAQWARENTPGQPYTLEQIAKVAGVTRERIRQIEARALKKLRHPERTKHFDQVLALPS